MTKRGAEHSVIGQKNRFEIAGDERPHGWLFKEVRHRQMLSRNTRKKTPQAASCTHLIQHEVARPRVLIKLLDVVSVVALLIGETEKSLLQDRVSSVPHRERDAQQLAIIAEPGQAVLAPAIYSAARPVMLSGPCGEYDHPQSGLASFAKRPGPRRPIAAGNP